MKKLILILILSGTWCACLSAQDYQVTVYGGANYVFKSGNESDYQSGVNDFPATPAHINGVFGAGISRKLYRNISGELDFTYFAKTKVTLTDPSDNDSIEIDTSGHFAVMLNVVYHFSKAPMEPYVIAGIGIDSVSSGGDQEVTSSKGYTIIIHEAESKRDMIFNSGGGIHYSFTDTLGLRAEVRYIMITSSPNRTQSIAVAVGIYKRF